MLSKEEAEEGLTTPPWLVNEQKLPTSTLPAILCLKTSTPRTSATISSVSYKQRMTAFQIVSLEELHSDSMVLAIDLFRISMLERQSSNSRLLRDLLHVLGAQTGIQLSQGSPR